MILNLGLWAVIYNWSKLNWWCTELWRRVLIGQEVTRLIYGEDLRVIWNLIHTLYWKRILMYELAVSSTDWSTPSRHGATWIDFPNVRKIEIPMFWPRSCSDDRRLWLLSRGSSYWAWKLKERGYFVASNWLI